MNPTEVDRMLRPLQLKDLRSLARVRGLNPAGGKEQLEDRIKENMLQTGNFSTQIPVDGAPGATPAGPYGAAPPYGSAGPGNQIGVNNNNYSRPGGQQNVGNFITDRPSSHVMAPPGGHSTIQLGGYNEPEPNAYQSPAPPYQHAPAPYATNPQGYGEDMRGGSQSNNYSRPGGQQNVGNFITDRPSSRVLAPPGGGSQIAFGEYNMPPPTAPRDSPYVASAPPYGTTGQPTSYGTSSGPQGPGGMYGAPPPAQHHAPPPAQQTGGYGYGVPSHGMPGPGLPAAGMPPSMAQPAGPPYGTMPPGMAGIPQAAGYIDPQTGRPVTAGSKSAAAAQGAQANNYSRPGGQQNVGNFLTDRPSSRVLAPPGGRSQISFG
ncbi:hypothetical protein HYH03_013781 [Edaphochlamys debaryana]|uniref:SAP domain-containing protein n=1 Tax=Edaphochlamys debaryana TaxID=47281 RepID=A0A835XRI8_9CHLO|nr:hypothetical protein HYH03_013781 [Edaphochlamys debaryana]|eukprot:KAG2487643.1 hypothetical protein HYH03_013781 [Edaphochlamys debaryana]